MIEEGATNEERLFLEIIRSLKEQSIDSALECSYAYAKALGRFEDAAYFKSVISDVKLGRSLGKREAILTNPQTVFEYWDRDRDNDPFPYDEKIERQIVSIKLKILDFIADVVVNKQDPMSKFLAVSGMQLEK